MKKILLILFLLFPISTFATEVITSGIGESNLGVAIVGTLMVVLMRNKKK